MEDSANSAPIPTSEVKTPRSGKRVFSLAYKRHILAELDACSYLGEKSALLRREGLYSSYICKWREHVADADKSTKKQRKKKGEGGRGAGADDGALLGGLDLEAGEAGQRDHHLSAGGGAAGQAGQRALGQDRGVGVGPEPSAQLSLVAGFHQAHGPAALHGGSVDGHGLEAFGVPDRGRDDAGRGAVQGMAQGGHGDSVGLQRKLTTGAWRAAHVW